MRGHWSIVAAAAITVGAMGLSLRAQDNTTNTEPKPTVGQRVENAADKTGEAVKNAADKTGEALKNAKDKTEDKLGLKKDPSASQTPHAGKIQGIIAQVTDAALTKKGLDDMAE